MDDLQDLDNRVAEIVSSAWSENTLSCRNSQWKKFFKFCSDRGLLALPASMTTLVRFLAFLESQSLKYVTINNYLSSVVVLHKFYGLEGNFRESYLMKTVLSGLKNRIGCQSVPMLPLTIEQLHSIWLLYPRSPLNDACWLATLICFCTLLRKSNVVVDDLSRHTLLRKDVVFYSDRVIFSVHTSKTRRKGENVLSIPIIRTGKLGFCVWSLLSAHFRMYPASLESPILLKYSSNGSTPLLYRDVLRFLKESVTMIGISPERFGLHSLRRSGAMHLQKLGIPLYEIQMLGDWRSMAVLLYLSSTYDRKVEIQHIVVSSLNEL